MTPSHLGRQGAAEEWSDSVRVGLSYGAFSWSLTNTCTIGGIVARLFLGKLVTTIMWAFVFGGAFRVQGLEFRVKTLGNTNSSAVFVPTLDSPDCIPFTRFPLQRNRRYEALNVHGCHHGLAILLNLSDREAIVWDPLTGHDYHVPFPPRFHKFTNGFVKNAAVLCAATEDGHVHGDCSLSPFKVAFMSNDFDQKHAMCCLYESESGVWGNIFLVATTSQICDERPGIIVGNLIYWLLDDGGIIELDLERQSLCVIEKPTNVHFTGYRYFQILWTKDDGVGLAILLKSNLRIQLWGRKLKNDGVRWVLQKTIQLDQLLSSVLPRDRKKTYILGYDNDSNTMVLSTAIGALMVQLDTMEFRNIPKRKHATYYPYRNFYTTGWLDI
uniref:F-box protein AT5G49610-like beta-propeller domain-containing protein n=1 Tax=Aegilops tauschii TaxID=37682 RepID=N1QSK4_AEGTA